MDSNIKISVIIPVYNDENYIERCLDSVVFNTDKILYEVICVDDGSTDNTYEILENYKKSHPNVQVFHREHVGLSSARNFGISKSIGEYVLFVDSDDYLELGMLEKIYNVSESNALDLLFFSFRAFGDNDEMISKYSHIINHVKRKNNYNLGVDIGKNWLIEFCRTNEYYVVVWAQFYRRNFLLDNNINFYDGIIYEDNLFTFTCLMKANRVYCINDILYNKCVRANSIVNKKESLESVKGFLVTILEIQKLIFSIENIENISFNYALDFVNKGLLKQLYKRFFRLDDNDKIKLFKACNPSEYVFMKQTLLMDKEKLYEQ